MPSRNIELNLPSSIPTSAAFRTRPSGKVGQSGGSLDTMMLLIKDSTKKVYVCFYVLLELAIIFFAGKITKKHAYVFLSLLCFFGIGKPSPKQSEN
jgi:hypothetical protein